MKEPLSVSMVFMLAVVHSHVSKESIKQRIHECFDIYFDLSSNASDHYEESVLTCGDNNRLTRKPVSINDSLKATMEQINAGKDQICENLQSCNEVDTDWDFFHCHKYKGGDNLDILFAIQVNASTALVDLNEHYDEEEKKFRICLIEARRIFRAEMTGALTELRSCLQS